MKAMRLGVITGLGKGIHEEFKKIKSYGFDTCQLSGWNEALFTDEYAELVKSAAKEYSIEITAFWCGWPGPQVWDFYEGPLTLGLVPQTFRHERLCMLMKGSDFAKKIGITDIATHVGYIPENPTDPEYAGLVSALKYLVAYFRKNGQYFLFETGQETPVTLKRIIEDIGLDNIGINFDPANFLAYGKANPVDAAGILGKLIRGVHAKDAEYPTDGKNLGVEKPLGQGSVNFPAFISKLKETGYEGAITIEREISGEQQQKDILAGKKLLESLI